MSEFIGFSWQVPARPLRSSFVATNAVALLVLVAAAWLARAALPLSGAFPWKAAAVFVGMLVLALGLVGAHHPFANFGPANQTTTIRALLVALLAALIGEPRLASVANTAAILTLVVACLDGVDGWLARRSHMSSDFGARFDMEVDALLVMVLSVLVWQYGKAGLWVLASGLLRYGFLVAGWQWQWLARPLMPSWRRKAICVVQIAGLNVAIVPAVPGAASAVVAAIALLVLVYSFAIDVAWLWRQAV